MHAASRMTPHRSACTLKMRMRLTTHAIHRNGVRPSRSLHASDLDGQSSQHHRTAPRCMLYHVVVASEAQVAASRKPTLTAYSGVTLVPTQ